MPEVKPVRYKEKPVYIDVVRWNGENTSDIIDWILSSGGTARWHEGMDACMRQKIKEQHIAIDTDTSTIYAVVGCWIYKDEWGDFYFCHPNVFDSLYTQVDTSLADWLTEEYTKAKQAARDAAANRDYASASYKHLTSNPRALEHCSATARMCALGETMKRMGLDVPAEGA